MAFNNYTDLSIRSDSAAVVMGIDCKGSTKEGADRHSIVIRKGRRVIFCESYIEHDPMQIVGVATALMEKYGVDKCFVDYGYGHAVIARFIELGYSKYVTGVNFGGNADNKKRFGNKRAEMAQRAKDWLELTYKDAGGVAIREDRELLQELALIPGFKPTSSGRLTLPPKKEIRVKYGKSPDKCDAFWLTFAFLVLNPNEDKFIRVSSERKARGPRKGLSSMNMLFGGDRNRERKNRGSTIITSPNF